MYRDVFRFEFLGDRRNAFFGELPSFLLLLRIPWSVFPLHHLRPSECATSNPIMQILALQFRDFLSEYLRHFVSRREGNRLGFHNYPVIKPHVISG